MLTDYPKYKEWYELDADIVGIKPTYYSPVDVSCPFNYMVYFNGVNNPYGCAYCSSTWVEMVEHMVNHPVMEVK